MVHHRPSSTSPDHEDGEVLRRGAISVETLRETAPSLGDLTSDAQNPQEAFRQTQALIDEGSGRDDGSEPTAGG